MTTTDNGCRVMT